MSQFHIRRVAVLGAGVMGAQIAAHLVNARIPVRLYDLPSPGEADQSAIANRAIWLLAATMALSTFAGCASDWDSKSVFLAGYESSYTKLHDCRVSAHPKAKYVTTWLSPDGKATLDAYAALPAGATGTVDFPEGTIVVKAQYDDAKCATVTGYTAMKKLAAGTDPTNGDWQWQSVDGDGQCADNGNCDLKDACSGCNQANPVCASTALFCTRP